MFIQYLFNKEDWLFNKYNVPFQIQLHAHNNQDSKLIARNVNENNISSLPIQKNQSINNADTGNNYVVKQNFTDGKLVYPTFASKLFNKYWQETIFLSIVNPLSDNYFNQLKSTGMAVYQHEYKKFLLDFSKALTARRIEVYLDDSKIPHYIKDSPTYIKYIWRKGFNFSVPENSLKKLFHVLNSSYSSRQQLILFDKIRSNDFPIFTVINGSKQLVMAEFPENMPNNMSLLDKFYQWYYNHILWTKSNHPVYEGLFFMNPQDAIEYKYSIKQKYPQSSKQNGLDIFASKLDLYYKMTRTSIPKVRFRLIPDLTELGELMFKYRKYKHVDFHNQQKYGRNYFQGQPIYLIQPVLAFNKKFKKVMNIEYRYKLSENKSHRTYEAIFMNYKTALTAWQKFRKENMNYILPSHPQLLVYNLEDFIKTCESNKQIYEKDILFIPSKESYDFVKQNHKNQSQIHVLQKISNTFLYLKILGKRMLWSLTSRQPISW